MHVIHTGRNCIARIEVISHSTAEVESEREGLSLRIIDPDGSLGINVPYAEANIKIGRNSPVTRDKIAAHAHDVDEIPCLRSHRNRGNRPAELKIPIPA